MKCELCHQRSARKFSSLCGQCSAAIETVMPVSEWEEWRHRDIEVNKEQIRLCLAYLEKTEKDQLARVITE